MNVNDFRHSRQQTFAEFGDLVVVRNRLHEDERGLLQQGQGRDHDDDHDHDGKTRVDVPCVLKIRAS